jgi:hypothetical protein
MMKKSLSARIRAALFRPRQVIVTDNHSPRPARKMYIRPISFMAFTLVSAAGILMLGFHLSDGNPARTQQGQITHLQHEQGRLKDLIAEKEAMLSLKDQQIESLNREIENARQQQESQQEKLSMFESILDVRKIHGVHLLQTAAQRLRNHSINYSFVLVKGGNYPRTASGTITFSTLNPANEVIAIHLDTGEDALPYSTQSHTFMQGNLPWNENWEPKILRISLTDHRGREIGLSEVKISD